VSNSNGQDEKWNHFINDGDLDALSGIYYHYFDLLFTYGMKHSIEKQAVEDAIQDVFMNLIKFRKSIGNVKNLPGYLVSAFRRQLFLDQNKHKRTILSVKPPEVQFEYFRTQEEDIPEHEIQEKLYLTIKQCIGKLTDKQQEIIYLRFECGVPYEEIAEMLHISVESCYKSVHRSIKSVRCEAEKILGNGHNLILCFLLGPPR